MQDDIRKDMESNILILKTLYSSTLLHLIMEKVKTRHLKKIEKKSQEYPTYSYDTQL